MEGGGSSAMDEAYASNMDEDTNNVVKTKGHASSSASRLISKREKAIKDATRPLRWCKACDELCHHDSRNCPMLKELETENELRKGKRKC